MDEPTDGFNPPATHRPYTVQRMMVHVLIIGCVLGVFARVGRGVGRAREAARSSICVGILKQIALALRNYESTWGCFPPAYVADAQGKPMHSWRVLILPYLGQDTLYQRYRFDEPWDGPHNRLLHDIPISLFSCPNHTDHVNRHETSYLAVVGHGTLFPGGNQTTRLVDVRDGTDQTIMVVESATTHIHWMEPRDLDLNRMGLRINDLSRPSISSWDREGTTSGPHIVTVGTMVRSFTTAMPPSYQRSLVIPSTMPPAQLRALLTINGGERVELP
ncbi:MAG: DUF1559 domain-containing protein [Isosphaeraceae bacterium]